MEELLRSKHCVATDDGVFELKPIETSFEVKGDPIPKEVVITLGKRDRLLEAYYKYMNLLDKFEAGNVDPNWLLTESEMRQFQKATLKMRSAESRLQQFGIVLSDLNSMDNVDMLKHPVVVSFMTIMEEYDTLNTEYTDKRLDRQKTANTLTVKQRFEIEIFLIVTEKISNTAEPVKRYTTELLLNEPYWAHQAELISDVFHRVLEYVLTELSIRVKKTEIVYEICKSVQLMIAESTKEMPMTLKDTTSLSNSVSSQSTTQEGFGALKKATQKKKSETS